MSTIVLSARGDVALVGELRRLLPSTPVAAIRDALASAEPLIERDLYSNDHDEAAAQLLGVVDVLQRFGASVVVEAIDGEERSVETVEYLRAIIERHVEIRRQREGRP